MIRKDGFGWEIWIFFYCNFMQNGVETIQFSTENISYWDLYFLCYNNECLFKYNLNNYLIHFFLFKCTYIIYRLFFLKTINWKQCRPLIILIGFSFQISRVNLVWPCFSDSCSKVSSLGVPRVLWHPQILADQLTLSQPGGQIMPT